ncbi:RTA1 like protein [Phellopilus nigrolimitatus]|nr:RTA1 like protein [Phellopilus nigrolimitatus]
MVSTDSLYGYIPTEWICIMFITLFAITTLLHIGEAVYFRMWWLFLTAVFAGVGELVGWSGRLWSAKIVGDDALNPYLMQITTTILAPTPLIAANFIILGRLIQQLGTQYSRLSPRWYTIIFCTADVVALTVQSVGGASASEAAETVNGNAETGGHIMLGGIVIQMIAITIYVSLAAEFLIRYYTRRPIRQGDTDEEENALDRKSKLMIFGLGFSTLCIFIRAVYRTIELSDGWTGRIIQTEVYFNVLDGGMICSRDVHAQCLPSWVFLVQKRT